MEERYDYLGTLKHRIRLILQDVNLEEYTSVRALEDFLNELSGSYVMYHTYSDAKRHVTQNMDLLEDAAYYFGTTVGECIDAGYEKCDTYIQVYLFPRAISEVLEEDDIEEELERLEEIRDSESDNEEDEDSDNEEF